MLPALDDTERLGCVVAIDPGSTRTGVAIYRYDYITRELVSVEAKTIAVDKLKVDGCVESISTEAATARLRALEQHLLRLFTEEKPDLVICEAPFFNPRMPGAFKVLVDCVGRIRDALFAYDGELKLFLIEPSNVKKTVNARKADKSKGETNKDPVKEAVMAIPEMRLFVGNPALLDEHAIDAIAIGKAGWWLLNG